MKKWFWTLLPYAEIILGAGVCLAQLIQRSPGFMGSVEDLVEVVLGATLVACGIAELIRPAKP